MGQLVLLADAELEYTYTARMVLTQYQVDDMVTIGVKLCKLLLTHIHTRVVITYAIYAHIHMDIIWGDRYRYF